MKLWVSVIEHKLGLTVKILEDQFGFRPGRLTTYASHLLQSIEQFRERSRDSHIVFTNLEKKLQ